MATIAEVRVYMPASHLRARDVMTPALAVAHPETPLADALTTLLDTDARLIPVTSADGRVVGVMTMSQLLRQVDDVLASHLLTMRTAADVREHILAHIEGRTVGQYMRAPATTVRDDAPLDAAARLLAARDITRAPVVRADGQLVGMLSEHALVTALAAPLLPPGGTPVSHDAPPDAPRDALPARSSTDTELGAALRASVAPGGGELLTAGALADRGIPSLTHAAPWSEVERAIEDLPETAPTRLALVVDADGGLLGVIEEHEVLRRLARAPAEGRWLALWHALARATGRPIELDGDAAQRAVAGELARHAAVITRPDTTIAVALAQMAQASEADYAVVAAESGAPIGVLWRGAALRALIGA